MTAMPHMHEARVPDHRIAPKFNRKLVPKCQYCGVLGILSFTMRSRESRLQTSKGTYMPSLSEVSPRQTDSVTCAPASRPRLV